MEENLDKLFDYRPLIPGSGRFASIVGIGGGGGRGVEQRGERVVAGVEMFGVWLDRTGMGGVCLGGE